MRRGILLLVPALMMLAAAPAAAVDLSDPYARHLLKEPSRPKAIQRPSVVAPYRYNPPPAALSPLDEQRARTYRNQLQGQVLDLQRQQADDPVAGRHLLETQSELDRMNDLLTP